MRKTVTKKYDVVIGGGGVMGNSVAFWISQKTGGKARIAVVEKDPTLKGAASSRSASSIRFQFTTPLNIQIGLFSGNFLRNLNTHLQLKDGESVDVFFKENGYLFLSSSQQGERMLKNNCTTQKGFGAKVEVLEKRKLAEKFGWLNCEDLNCGSFGLEGEGFFDAGALVNSFKNKAKENNVDYLKDTISHFSLTQDKQAVEKVHLISGEEIECGFYVNCTGTNGQTIVSALDEKVGKKISFPVLAKKRQVFVFDCKDKRLKTGDGKQVEMPLTIDVTGLYWRSDSATKFICGISPNEEEDDTPQLDDFQVDYSIFQERLWPILAHRVPAFENLKLHSAWYFFSFKKIPFLPLFKSLTS